MRRYTIFIITVNALHVSGGFSAHHQELKNCARNVRYMSCLLAATALMLACLLPLAVVASKHDISRILRAQSLSS